MKEKPFRHIIGILSFVVLLVVSACQQGRTDSVTMRLQSDTPTMVSFPLMAASQIYDFDADIQLPVYIRLIPITSSLAYTAELRDSSGKVMASVASSAIQDAVLTVAPGTTHYQVAIKSDNTLQQGMLSVQVSHTTANMNAPDAVRAAVVPTPVVVPYQFVGQSITSTDDTCAASSSSGLDVNLRNGPGTTYPVVGTLPNGGVLSVIGQSRNGWYQVVDNGQLVWVSASVTALGGNCATLADVTPVTIKDDAPQLVIDDNGWGSVYANIASTDAQPRDLITVSAPNLTINQRYQEFDLTLLCSGTGTDDIRWGASENPTLKCGGSIIMPMTTAYHQQVVAVTLLPAPFQYSVQYTLMASRRT